MICRICGDEGWRQTHMEPAEPCPCGQMADCSPWDWDRWRGVRNRLRYVLAGWLIYRAGRIHERGYIGRVRL